MYIINRKQQILVVKDELFENGSVTYIRDLESHLVLTIIEIRVLKFQLIIKMEINEGKA